METISVQPSVDHIRGVGVPSAGINRAAAVAALILLVAAAATIAWRWSFGVLVYPLYPPALLAATATATISAVLIRSAWFHHSNVCNPLWLDRTITILVSLAVVKLIVCLCIPGTPAAYLAAVGIMAAVEESWAWIGHFRRWEKMIELRRAGIRLDESLPVVRNGLRSGDGCIAARLIESCDTIPPDNVVQQLIRSRAADGREVLSGWLRTYFAAGQRTDSVHVAFCPPMETVPEVAVEQIDGPEARIKTAQVLPYGVRLDLKLAAAAHEPTEVLLQFSAASAREK